MGVRKPGRRAGNPPAEKPSGVRMPVALIRRVVVCLIIAAPAITLRIADVELAPVIELLAYGAAVVAAAFLLAWAAEAAQKDISGPLAIALLALIAVLPEYAVDFYFAFRSGTDPQYVHYAAANMTGSNRLLLGIGWPLVVIISALTTRGTRSAKDSVGALRLDSGSRLDIGVLTLLCGHRHADRGEGQSVEPAGGVPADRSPARRGRDRSAPGRTADRGIHAHGHAEPPRCGAHHWSALHQGGRARSGRAVRSDDHRDVSQGLH